jgi:hypothetical protein
MFGGSHDPESLRTENRRLEACVSATSAIRRKRDGSLWVEVALLAPVMGLLLLGVLEVRHALKLEARLARAANRVAEAGQDAVAAERVALSETFSVAQALVQIESPKPLNDGPVTVSVPYAETGSALAFLWPTAIASAESRVVR